MRILKIVRGAAVFTMFYVGGALMGMFVLPFVALAPGDEMTRIRRNQRLVTRGFMFTLDVLRWTRIFDFDPRTVDASLPAHPVIVVSNHPTTIDVVAVLAVFRDAVVVIKDKIWHDPFLRFLFRHLGHLRGGDGSIGESLRVMSEVQARLDQGFSVVIFPEGTRSPPRGLDTMMKGAFAIASRAHTDIVPVCITAEPPALHKAAPWHDFPVEPVAYRIARLPTVSARSTSARKLQHEVTVLYQDALGLPRTVATRPGASAEVETEVAASPAS